mmetsp:Transcript_64167/g.139658  ORF Transcript_64167/g.139658 Transcript_64167/m.139658 type:complete len:99 (-) Transcript_64167:1934-2230(-)
MEKVVRHHPGRRRYQKRKAQQQVAEQATDFAGFVRQLRPIPGIEEVTLLRDDDSVLTFSLPQVNVSVPNNTYVVRGSPSLSFESLTKSATQGALDVDL